MPSIERFEDIQSWQKGRELCKLVYNVTRQSGFARDYALRDQIRRAAVSIPSNIAEGFNSQNDRTFARHLYIARASSAEVQSQAYIALDQNYIDQTSFNAIYGLCRDITRLLTRLIQYLQQSPGKEQRA